MPSHEPIAHLLAIIPSIQGAVKISGEGASRMCLDADEQQLPEVMKLVAFGRDKVLKVTIETAE